MVVAACAFQKPCFGVSGVSGVLVGSNIILHYLYVHSLVQVINIKLILVLFVPCNMLCFLLKTTAYTYKEYKYSYDFNLHI